MLTLLKVTVCLVNTSTWRTQEIEFLCCELTENVSSVLSPFRDLTSHETCVCLDAKYFLYEQIWSKIYENRCHNLYFQQLNNLLIFWGMFMTLAVTLSFISTSRGSCNGSSSVVQTGPIFFINPLDWAVSVKPHDLLKLRCTEIALTVMELLFANISLETNSGWRKLCLGGHKVVEKSQ